MKSIVGLWAIILLIGCLSPASHPVITSTKSQSDLTAILVTSSSNEQLAQVVISELVAANEDIIADEDGDTSDWIELHNRTPHEINLNGWYLTDNAGKLTKWQFPSVTLEADGYLLVFASSKDRVMGEELHTNFKLSRNGEYLALIQPDGKTIAWEYAPEYPLQFPNVAYGLDNNLTPRYFTVPTPGSPNSSNQANLGPIISDTNHWPPTPEIDEIVQVATTLQPSSAPVESVQLHYRIMFGETHAVAMFDDGLHGDGVANDGIYGGTIPNTTFQSGTMLRYYISATDMVGNQSRWPLYYDLDESPEYLGTIIADPTISSTLPVLHWFVEDIEATNTFTGTRASLYYDGSFYDNLFVRVRGGASYIKKSYKFDMNKSYWFQFDTKEAPVEEFNVNHTLSDSTYVRQPLSWETYRDAGVLYSTSFPMRLQQNGEFFSVAIFVEQVDERYLERQGLDPNGALYKMYNLLTSATDGAVKKTRQNEDSSDLESLVQGIDPENSARTEYLFDNVDLPSVINYLAATVIIEDFDHIFTNYYLYRDTEGTGEWRVLPWDKDRTFGLVTAAADPIFGHPFYGSAAYPRFEPDGWNRLIEAIYGTPILREMYLRRLRTLMDELLQSPETSKEALYYERRLDQFFNQMKADVALDAITWEMPDTFAESIDTLKSDYLAIRRQHLFNTLGSGDDSLIPTTQPITTTINIGMIEKIPMSGNLDEEYFTLVNPNNYAVDISDWYVHGDIAYTFQPGVVVPANGTLYVSPNVVAFRNRRSSPTGGEKHFAQGDYDGRLSNSTGTLMLHNTQGVLIDKLISSSSSPLAGNLLITELNYHPPGTNEIDGDEFEFVELKNVSTEVIDLGGLQFTEGINYTFPTDDTLASGEMLVLIRNVTAFHYRYPSVAYNGIYSKKLSNSGELVKLVDADGLTVFSFEYNDALPWPEMADGDGYTLVRQEPFSDPNSSESWRASRHLWGSPGENDNCETMVCNTSVYLPFVVGD